MPTMAASNYIVAELIDLIFATLVTAGVGGLSDAGLTVPYRKRG
jgi:hypothetical protein